MDMVQMDKNNSPGVFVTSASSPPPYPSTSAFPNGARQAVENVLRVIFKDGNVDLWRLEQEREVTCCTGEALKSLVVRPVPMAAGDIPLPTQTKLSITSENGWTKSTSNIVIYDERSCEMFRFTYKTKGKKSWSEPDVVLIFVPGVSQAVGSLSYTNGNLEAGVLTDFVTNMVLNLVELKTGGEGDGYHLVINHPRYPQDPFAVAHGTETLTILVNNVQRGDPNWEKFALKFYNPAWSAGTALETSPTTKSLILAAYCLWVLLYYSRQYQKGGNWKHTTVGVFIFGFIVAAIYLGVHFGTS